MRKATDTISVNVQNGNALRNRTQSWWLRCIPLSPLFLLAGQAALAADPDSGPPVREDSREFVAQGPEKEASSGGYLKFGFCCSRTGELVTIKRAFKLPDDSTVGVNVELSTHPKEYAFLSHDFYGMYIALADKWRGRESNCPRGSTRAERIACLSSQWQVVERSSGLLINIVAQEDPLIGLVGWYHESATENVVVLLKYRATAGLPVQVVDTYLQKYPSAVDRAEVSCLNWIDDDLNKWVTLLRSRGDDRMVTGWASAGLDRRGSEDFGFNKLQILQMQGAEPEAIRQQSATIADNIERWRDENAIAKADALVLANEAKTGPLGLSLVEDALECQAAISRAQSAVAVQAGKGVPEDSRQFVSTGSQSDSRIAGYVKDGLCCFDTKGPATKTQSYKSREKRNVYANVGVMKYPKEYALLAHDFYGIFITLADRYRDEQAKTVAAVTGQDRLTSLRSQWQVIERESGLCVNIVQKERPLEGLVGWYHEGEEDNAVVLVTYKATDGIPIQVIDEHMQQYPSSIELRDAECHDWIRRDLDKWAHILRMRGDDSQIMRKAEIGLGRYRRDSFGIDDLSLLEMLEAEPEVLQQRARDIADAVEQWRIRKLGGKAEKQTLSRKEKADQLELSRRAKKLLSEWGGGSEPAKQTLLVEEELTEDSRELVSDGQAMEQSGFGQLRMGLCCSRPRNQSALRQTFRDKDGGPGWVEVEISTHTKDYDFIAHDFFGMCLALTIDRNAGPRKHAGDSSPEKRIADCQNKWQVVHVERESSLLINIRNPNSPHSGWVCWYREGPVNTVVVVSYSELDGLPTQILDSFLQRYPSTVDLRAADCSQWVEDDLDKWTSLLRSHGWDREVLRTAAAGLLSYRKDAFGLREITRPRSRDPKPEELRGPVEDAIQELERWRAKRTTGER